VSVTNERMNCLTDQQTCMITIPSGRGNESQSTSKTVEEKINYSLRSQETRTQTSRKVYWVFCV